MTSYVSLPLYAASIGQRLRLEAARCSDCGALAYPQRPVCRSCRGRSFSVERLSGRGRLHTYTVIAPGGAPAEFDRQQTMTGALAVGIIDLVEGPRLTAQLADVEMEALHIGLAMRAVVRRLYDQEGVIRYGTKFVPDEAP
ncbi:MAG: OB-fold domain-containing protein [Kiloniellales bacterium]|nr:OB-fold domain-containing protein [Kiloniellales bacterium]